MLILYNLFTKIYFLAIQLAALWNRKAAAWVNGRKNVFVILQKSIQKDDQIIWVHCSSAGEFEQGKPVIEALKENHPMKKILVTFFSPSGYSVAKNYAPADVIAYLPLDTKNNADRFYKLVKPELVIFVKYEFWYHHLAVAAFHHVPLLLISAVFRKDQVFFKPYGQFFRKMLFFFRHIFLQDEASFALLHANGISHSSISGDTRFDRVLKIRENFSPVPFIDDFVAGKKVIVAGSTWEGDEEVLHAYMAKHPDVKMILAPHEISSAHLVSLQKHFPNSYCYSFLKQENQVFPLPDTTGSNWMKLPMDNAAELDHSLLQQVQVLIIDSVGLLSRLYHYASITYVGGGYTKDGIHNILEAAVWGKPVIFGPNYKKYREGKEMIKCGGAFSISVREDLNKIADDLLGNEDHLQEVGLKAKNYIDENTGATSKIMQLIQEKRLLTRL